MTKELQFLMYNTPEENVSVNAVIRDETLWLTQKAMGELFDCTTDNISLHLKNIYADGELKESSTTEEFSIVQRENTFTMEQFSASINEFLTFRKYKILPDKGKVSKQMALDKAGADYDEFNKTQKITSDFDREVKKLVGRGGKADE